MLLRFTGTLVIVFGVAMAVATADLPLAAVVVIAGLCLYALGGRR